MGQLIDDLLAFSRLSRVTMKKQGIDMAAQVTVVWNDLIGQYPNRDATLLLGDIPPCRGDHSLMRQVWVNLLANALKYTGCKPAAVVEVGCRREAGNMIYFVKDNGAGFDMRYVHRLFGVFQRLHRADEYEGTGVGLAIAQRIVHRHGGRIWAEGTINAGATFSFTLNEPPRAREPTQQHPG
jgi:light-regulated signal transduction histidine kinase (bacteriophytochrome)